MTPPDILSVKGRSWARMTLCPCDVRMDGDYVVDLDLHCMTSIRM